MSLQVNTAVFIQGRESGACWKAVFTSPILSQVAVFIHSHCSKQIDTSSESVYDLRLKIIICDVPASVWGTEESD